jgi:hypothetical protein
MDPDPDSFINKQKIKKNFNFYSFVTFVISAVNVPSVSKKQKKNFKTWGGGGQHLLFR